MLQESVYETFSKRGTSLKVNQTLFSKLFAKDQNRNLQWNAFLNRSGLDNISFEIAMNQITTFFQPIYNTILYENEYFWHWNCVDRKWEL